MGGYNDHLQANPLEKYYIASPNGLEAASKSDPGLLGRRASDGKDPGRAQACPGVTGVTGVRWRRQASAQAQQFTWTHLHFRRVRHESGVSGEGQEAWAEACLMSVPVLML